MYEMRDNCKEEHDTNGSWQFRWRGLGAGVEDCVIQATGIIMSKQWCGGGQDLHLLLGCHDGLHQRAEQLAED